MSKLFIQSDTLSAIGNAIRAKAGTSSLLAPGDMPTAIANIPTGGGGDKTDFLLDGSTNNLGGSAGTLVLNNQNLCNFIYGDAIQSNVFGAEGVLQNNIATDNLSNFIIYKKTYDRWPGSAMLFPRFYNKCGTKTQPIITFTNSDKSTDPSTIRLLPYMNEGNDMFAGCGFSTLSYPITPHIPFVASDGSGYEYRYFFRHFMGDHIEKSFMQEIVRVAQSNYNGLFANCYRLQELEDIPVFTNESVNWNMFTNTFDNMGRISKITFETNEDGSAKTANWANQIIDLSQGAFGGGPYGGYQRNTQVFNGSDYGCPHNALEDHEMAKDDSSYSRTKDNNFFYAYDVKYSRWNRAAAFELIKSLPDTTGYSASPSNTLKMKRASGSATPEGGIGSLSSYEIAIATSKGWTIALA